jgi:protein TonB
VLIIVGCASRQIESDSAATALASCAGMPSPDSTVFDTTQVTQRPQILSRPGFEYPLELRIRRISGQVLITAVIGRDGLAEPNTIVVVRSDHPDFTPAARRLVHGSRWSPGCKDGQAVRVRVTLPIDFNVRG